MADMENDNAGLIMRRDLADVVRAVDGLAKSLRAGLAQVASPSGMTDAEILAGAMPGDGSPSVFAIIGVLANELTEAQGALVSLAKAYKSRLDAIQARTALGQAPEGLLN